MKWVGQNLKHLYSKYEFRFWPWIAALGVVLIVRGQWRWFKDIEAVRPGGIPVLEGLLLLLIALRWPALVADSRPLLDLSVPRRFPWRWKLLVTLAGIGLCVYAGWRAYPERTPVWYTLLLWGLGICLTIAGLVPRRSASVWWRTLLDSVRHDWHVWLMVGALFTAGLVVRAVRLGTVPSIMAGDEA
ncbi:MAG TPA: hypothetical protein VMT24_16830, partial [Aggregatilineaceae bacterium]|nr:hypothetical protein [Aggregatilineaceae bacterium]